MTHEVLRVTVHAGNAQPCCDYGPDGHTEQQHHDASPGCVDQACPFDHPQGGPYPHPCDKP